MDNILIQDKNLFLKNKIKNWLINQKTKDILRFLTCGSVDDGKSTLIGRLLYDNNDLYKDEVNSLYIKNSSNIKKLDFSLLVDGLQAEREQGITIDVAYRYFSTKKRKFIIADTPGHEQYTRNMVTGASTCDLAILLIDVCKGMTEQTRRHSFICILLGIKNIIIAINKMDLVEYKQDFFEKIKDNYINFINQFFKKKINVYFVPISALLGYNIVTSNNKFISWYNGPTLLEILETVKIKDKSNNEIIRFPVQYVNRQDLNFRCYSGTLVSGSLELGQKIKVLPSGFYSSIKKIITFDGNLSKVDSDQAITLLLNDNIDISRGDILVSANEKTKISKSAIVDIVWMDKKPLCSDQSFDIKIANKKICCYINEIINCINVDTLQRNKTNILNFNSIGLVKIDFQEPIFLDEYNNNKVTGGMIFIDRLNNNTVGAGMVINPIFFEDNINVLKYKKFEIELDKLIHRFFYS